MIRPKDPALALKLARTALDENDGKLFDSMIEANDYTFVGWLEQGGERIIDKQGKEIDKLQPGDSFITFKEPPS